MCICVCLSMCTYVSESAHEGQESASSRAGVTGGYEPSNMGAKNETRDLSWLVYDNLTQARVV